jgi:hypothetical protein
MSLPNGDERETEPDKSRSRFEVELTALTPRSAQFDRDRLMFLAGQASVRVTDGGRPQRRWPWPAAFSAMTAVAAGLLVMMLARPEPQVVQRIVRVPMPPRADTAATAASSALPELLPTARRKETESGRQMPNAPPAAYLELRDRVLALGWDSWSTPASSSGDGGEPPPASNRELLNYLLHDG